MVLLEEGRRGKEGWKIKRERGKEERGANPNVDV